MAKAEIIHAWHARLHSIISTLDHSSAATPDKILKADANGLPVEATNADAEVADAVAKRHTQGTDTALGAVGTKNPPIDADKALYRDSTAGDALVTSTWTQVKAFLKTYFDTLYGAIALAHNRLHSITSILDHTSGATPGQILKANANGLPVDASNTDIQVAATVALAHAKQHAITSAPDHTSAATPGKMLKADANGLPVNAANTDADVADAVSKKHTQGTDTALGAVGTKNPPIDADKVLQRNSTAADALVTSTWAQIKTFLMGSHPLLSTQNLTYYIDEISGNDNNDGLSAATAFKTWTKAETMIPTFVGHYYNIRIIGNLTGNISLGARIIGGYVRIMGDTTTPGNQIVSGGGKLTGVYGPAIFQYLRFLEQESVTGSVASPKWIDSAWRQTFCNCELFGGIWAGGTIFLQTSMASISNCDFGTNGQDCIYALASVVFSQNNTGNGAGYGLRSLSSFISKAGTQPTGTTGNEAYSSGGLIAPLRDQPNISSSASGNISPDLCTANMHIRTALSAAPTINNPIGTPLQGEHLIIRLKDNETARAITWDTQYRGLATALPSTTVISKLLYMEFRFNSTDTKWDMITLTQEA